MFNTICNRDWYQLFTESNKYNNFSIFHNVRVPTCRQVCYTKRNNKDTSWPRKKRYRKKTEDDTIWHRQQAKDEQWGYQTKKSKLPVDTGKFDSFSWRIHSHHPSSNLTCLARENRHFGIKSMLLMMVMSLATCNYICAMIPWEERQHQMKLEWARGEIGEPVRWRRLPCCLKFFFS